MACLIKNSWSDISVNWLESDIQIAICNHLRKLPEYGSMFNFSARINEGKRSPRQASEYKLMGMQTGDPDIDIWLPENKCFHIELKRSKQKKAKLSQSQKDKHEEFTKLRHDIYTIYATCPEDGILQVEKILSKYL